MHVFSIWRHIVFSSSKGCRVEGGGGDGSSSSSFSIPERCTVAQAQKLGVAGLENTRIKKYCFLIAALQVIFSMDTLVKDIQSYVCKCKSQKLCALFCTQGILEFMSQSNMEKAVLSRIMKLGVILITKFPKEFSKDDDGHISYGNASSAFECLFNLYHSCVAGCGSELVSRSRSICEVNGCFAHSTCGLSLKKFVKCSECGISAVDNAFISYTAFPLAEKSVESLIAFSKLYNSQSNASISLSFESALRGAILVAKSPFNDLRAANLCALCSPDSQDGGYSMSSIGTFVNLSFSSLFLEETPLRVEFLELQKILPMSIDFSALFDLAWVIPSPRRYLRSILFYGCSHFVVARHLSDDSWVFLDDD